MANSQGLAGSDVASIAQVRENWLSAISSDSIDGLLNPLSNDCLVFPPHEAPLAGIGGSRSWHEARIAQFTTRLTMSSEELVGAGDWAFERLSYAIGLTPRAGGATIQDRGSCFWVWRREPDGPWKLARAIWNSANPIAATV